jgi:hypothetical protein
MLFFRVILCSKLSPEKRFIKNILKKEIKTDLQIAAKPSKVNGTLMRAPMQ